MKRERIFYLDFIRALAVILILLTHYNALFLYMDPQPLDKVVITYKICNLYIGDFGVSLFFIISGAALMYVYENSFYNSCHLDHISFKPHFYAVCFLLYTIFTRFITKKSPDRAFLLRRGITVY